MHPLENDMDDLFKKAAANYPLKSGDSDWESVAKKITGGDNSQTTKTPVKRRNNKKILMLLAALFLFLSGGVTYQLLVSGGKSRKAVPYKTTANVSSSTQDRIPGSANIKIPEESNALKNNKSVAMPANPETTDQTQPANNTSGSFYNNKFSGNENVDNGFSSIAVDKNLASADRVKNFRDIRNSNYNIDRFAQFIQQGNSPSLNVTGKKIASLIHNKEKNTPSTTQKGFYVGAVMGPDFSKVETGSFGNTGFYAGIIAGYQFNKIFSLETGVSWNKKNYASDGKYFSMDKIRSTMPSGMVLNNLESQVSLFEIPVRAKINFLNKPNTDLFITGGVSAYLMAKEKNLFYATVNGTQEKMARTYENNSGFPAVAGLSAGYEHNFLESFKIRIEPYLKIPLQGMGVGKLPVTSAGIQIGVTEHFK